MTVIGNRSVQMTELSAAEPELDSSKAVSLRRDPLPASNSGADSLDRRMWGQLIAITPCVHASARDRMSLLTMSWLVAGYSFGLSE